MNRAICRSVVRAAAFLAPRAERPSWRAEWLAEVDHSWNTPATARRRIMLTRRTLTSVPHALWFRKEQTQMNIAGFLLDFRVAGRTLWRQRGFTVAAAATLALGIGANTAVFSIINRTLLTELPFAHPEQLVEVWETLPSQNVAENTPAPATFDYWREQSRLAVSFAAYTSSTTNITGDGAPEQLRALRASASLLSVLGVQPLLGRGFTADDDRFGGPGVVMLTHGFWVRRFQADRSIVGRVVTLDGNSSTVAGVLPENLPTSLRSVDVWVPLALKPTESRESRMLWVVGRMKAGVSPAALQQELDAAMHRPGDDQPFEGIGVTVKRMDDELRGGVRPDLLLIFAVSGVVLLIACANIATMMLARGLTRHREMAIRASLGAGRARLARLLVAESAMLGLVGGAAGLIVGAWSSRVLQSLMPAALAGIVSGGLDSRVLAFTFAIAMASALAAGLAPLAGIGRGSLMVTSRTSDGQERKSAGLVRAGLVSAQMALAVVLLSGAALLTRTFVAIVRTPTGFTPTGVLTAQVPRADADDARRTEFYERLLDATRRIPGVTSAGLINGVPVRWTGGGSGFAVDEGKNASVPAHHRIVSSQYFASMGIPILSGETFSGSERKGAEAVAIVSESFAKAAWGDPKVALGRRIRWGADGSWIRVIGVAGDIRLLPSRPPEPHVYLPFTQVQFSPYAPSDVVLKTDGDPAALAGALREAVRAIDPNQPVAAVMTMNGVISRAMGGRRFTLSLMAVFAALALVLCAVGIYGVLSYTVSRRTREFGVRIAIGATGGRVRLGVVRQGLSMTLTGALCGSAAAVLMSRWLATVVPGLTALDAAPVAAAAAILVAVSAIAADIPARRAMRVDPITALRDN
jgi:predicted permease